MVGDVVLEHSFSIEMQSKKDVRHLSLSDKSHDRVFFDGSLGELIDVSLIEVAVLEIKGKKGVLRIDLSEDELRTVFDKKLGSG